MPAEDRRCLLFAAAERLGAGVRWNALAECLGAGAGAPMEQRCLRLIAETGLDLDAADVRLLGRSPARNRRRCSSWPCSASDPAWLPAPESPAVLAGYWGRAGREGLEQLRASRRQALPPARDLAAVLGVNANTVLRALRTLREEGLVEFRRGRGVSVTGAAPRRSPVVAKARELVALARQYGFRPEELAEIIEQVSWESS